MSNQVTNHPDHDEIVSLLPWFVNKTLEASQREAVLSHIEHCDDCQREIQSLTFLKDTVQTDARNNYRMHADVDKDLASVMNRIDASHSVENTASATPSWQQKLADLFKFATALPIAQRSATVLACLLVTVIGFQLYYGQADNNYSVLSSSDTSNSAMRLSVDISTTENPDEVRSKIQHEFEKIGQEVDLETEIDGEYIIVFKKSVSVTELSKLISDLENKLQIKSVEILP